MRINERTSSIIADTLPLMEGARAELLDSMRSYITRESPSDWQKTRDRVEYATLFDVLFSHARNIGEVSRAGLATGAADHHVGLKLNSRHYSSFGDGLKPIMKDVLGVAATPAVLAAWGDAFWAAVRALPDERQALLAA